MRSSLLYRVSAILLVLFCVGHTLGFRKTDVWPPQVAPVIASMQSVHFPAQGFTRTYWDFYTGFGLFVSLLLLLAAALAWQLGRLPKESLALISPIRWGLAICFLANAYLSWRYFFMTPIVFSAVIFICLLLAALAPA